MRIGSLWGISFVVNPLFLLLLAICAYLGYLTQVGLAFAVVLLHELSHLIVAKLHHLAIGEVELLPFGGVARIEELVQLNPPVEKRVALAGPISNLGFAAMAYLIHPLVEIPEMWYAFFVQANLGMAVFNMLPALPLDGGRVLRSHLVKTQGFRAATERAAHISKAIALFLGILGLVGVYVYGYWNSLIFVVLAFFLYGASRKEKDEASYIFMRYLTQKKRQLRLARVMEAKELVATNETSLGEVVRAFTPPAYHVVWVVNLDGELLGMVGELEIINGLFEKGIHGKLNELVKYKL